MVAPKVVRWARSRRGERAARGADEGFGLVEVLVSMALLAVVLVAVGAGMLYALRAATASRERSVATGLLGAAEASLQEHPDAIAGWSQAALGGVTYRTTTTETTVASVAATSLVDVTIIVSWSGAGGSNESVSGNLQVVRG